MAWIALIGAGIIEVFGVMNMKNIADGKRIAILYAVIALGSSLFCLSYALKEIPMGTGYAIWTGIGTVGSALAGIILHNDSKDVKRLLCIAVILASTVALKFLS